MLKWWPSGNPKVCQIVSGEDLVGYPWCPLPKNGDHIFEIIGEEGAEMPKYEATLEELGEVHKRFSYHTVNVKQGERSDEIRELAHALAITILENCPKSRERSQALSRLDECLMSANSSIARNE